MELNRVPFDPAALAREVTTLFGENARAKGVALDVDIGAGVPAQVSGDAVRVRQVLSNMVGNAVKFTDQGSVSVALRTVPGADGATRLRFVVRDSGIGIAPESVEKLFEPFTQGDGFVTRRFGGSGLGLAICKRLVTIMGGSIGATGEKGRGSEFWFEVPIAEQQAAANAPSATLVA